MASQRADKRELPDSSHHDDRYGERLKAKLEQQAASIVGRRSNNGGLRSELKTEFADNAKVNGIRQERKERKNFSSTSPVTKDVGPL
ncbi:hypothetical protein CEXT_278721 [Caerostris extrusa]|uniref:Uncharacterized protein n=1 Tax=Caerostris extrusa TaxID=172846 RepID=A0AAV4MEM5_CAEEX|nr:hypothetical protein CEXT_278721 [Caerostris extrusa]